ncbi:MAG: chromosome segregation protein SMC, partial [Chitinophagaceae bacterium]
AKKAEKYFEIKKEYRELSIELAKAALEGFNLTYRDLTAKVEVEINRNFELESAIIIDEEALEHDKLGFIEKEKVLHQLQHAFNDLVQKIRTKDNDKNLVSQKLNFLNEKHAGIKQFLENSQGQLNHLESGLDSTSKQLTEEEGRWESLQDVVEEKKVLAADKKKIFDAKRTEIDTVRSENLQLQRQQFEAEKRVAVADSSIQNISRTLGQMADEAAMRSGQLKQLEEEKTEKDQLLVQKKNVLQELQEHHEKTREQILQAQSHLEKQRQQLAEENRKLDSRKNEHALLKSLIDSMEGYPESVKFLHKNPLWNHTAPILSDIIYVQKEFRTAVENVLEPYLNYYIVNDLQEGLQAVHLLEENRKGKANFFLMDKVNETADKYAGEESHAPADTIPAMDVIEVDEQYRKLAENLLGNVYIAGNEEALAGSNGSIVLEKHGKYVKGKYSLSGGSIGLFEGKKIGRVKNLEKIYEEIQGQEVVVNKLKTEIQTKQQDVAEFTGQLKDNLIRQTQNEINSLTSLCYSIDNKLESLEALQNSSTTKRDEMQKQLDSTHNSTEGTRISLAALIEQITAAASNLTVVEQSYKMAEREYNEAGSQYNEFNLQFIRQQNRLNTLKQELEYKNRQINELKAQIESNASQQKMAAESISENEQQLSVLEEELNGLLHTRETDELRLNETDQAYYNYRNQISEKESALRHKVKAKEQVEHLLSSLKDRINDLKVQLAGMKERLQVEFRINIDDIIDQPRSGEVPVEELQEKNDRMKKRLENLGEINPTAIEAFQEMKKRYEFIIEQKNDLVTAKDSLLQTIAEVETTANQQFLDTFNKVRENFKMVFKALFTEEDTADMVLEDPENLAETGIDIVAKPKGKRPSSITQLSGGEKTLTATALLFAIYLIKPAPFCILDEVDAPLDDANVGKFTNMIRKFSEESQFIIVTHNKMTMASVDVIYGVTMQEPGVSRLVPVDFRGLN